MKINFFIKTLAAAIAASLILCGCDNSISSETATTSGERIPDGINGEFLVGGEDNTVSEYPVIVNDLTVASSPERVICLSSSLTEIICELGFENRLIGRGSYCSYPETVAELKDYGKPSSPDLDAIKADHPDMVITATSIPSKDVTALSELGISVLYIQSPRSVEEFGRIYSALGMVFEGLFEGEKSGTALYGEIIHKLTESGVSLGRFIYVTEGAAVAGGDTFESSVLSLFGGNAAKDASGYSFDKSLLTDDQPDVIVLNKDVPKSVLTSDSTYSSLNAVVNDRIITVDNAFFESPSGRITEITDELSGAKGDNDEA